MVVVWREAGLRFVIFVDDHEPAHIHVFGDGNAKINLNGPVLVWSSGMKNGDVRRAMEIVSEQRLLLLKRWKDIHG
jgi:hypothetical protein